jgi:hypothetical protein
MFVRGERAPPGYFCILLLLFVCLFVAEPHFNKNKNNPRKMKESVRKKLGSSLQMEYDFYYFVKKKLMSQYHSIK